MRDQRSRPSSPPVEPPGQPPAHEPSWRRGAGMALIVLLILIWAGLVASAASWVGRWPVLVQAAFYLVVGMAWIIPLKPLVRWSQTGSWRPPARGSD